MTTTSPTLTLIEFGPVRAIGLSATPVPNQPNFSALWDKLLPRAGEISRPATPAAFGVCRCIPGKTDGSFEYLALLEATASSPIPPGMLEVTLPRSSYAILDALALATIGQAWSQLSKTIAAQTLWTPYCGPQGCQCATHPGFEYYAPNWSPGQPIRIQVPVHRA